MADSIPHPSLYPYDPSKPLPIVFAAIIFILGTSLIYQSYRSRWFHFCAMVTWASITWLAGFVTRAVSVFDPANIGLFIAQYVLVFVGPPLYAASEYFILGRLLAYLPYHAPIHPGRVMSTFFMLSAAVEALAASGAASIVSVDAKPGVRSAAISRIKASLILQEVLETAFFGMVALIEYRCRKAGSFPRNVRIICRMLYVTSFMMTLRCIVRTVEGFEATGCDPTAPGFKGYCGPVQRYEWFLWVFEVANITLFIALLAIFHPGRYLPSDQTQYLDPTDGVTERMGPGYSAADNRPWLITVLDPFDIGGMISGKGASVDRFWERENPVAVRNFAEPKTKEVVEVERGEMVAAP
jgi:hypothetical protein